MRTRSHARIGHSRRGTKLRSYRGKGGVSRARCRSRQWRANAPCASSAVSVQVLAHVAPGTQRARVASERACSNSTPAPRRRALHPRQFAHLARQAQARVLGAKSPPAAHGTHPAAHVISSWRSSAASAAQAPGVGGAAAARLKVEVALPGWPAGLAPMSTRARSTPHLVQQRGQLLPVGVGAEQVGRTLGVDCPPASTAHRRSSGANPGHQGGQVCASACRRPGRGVPERGTKPAPLPPQCGQVQVFATGPRAHGVTQPWRAGRHQRLHGRIVAHAGQAQLQRAAGAKLQPAASPSVPYLAWPATPRCRG
jgi:hypothetical protein